MNDKKKLRLCFQFLNEDLGNIRHLNPDLELRFEGHAVHSIISEGIYACDEEEAQQSLGKYLQEIESLSIELPAIIEALIVNDTIDFGGKRSPRVDQKQAKVELQNIIALRLSFYTKN